MRCPYCYINNCNFYRYKLSHSTQYGIRKKQKDYYMKKSLNSISLIFIIAMTIFIAGYGSDSSDGDDTDHQMFQLVDNNNDQGNVPLTVYIAGDSTVATHIDTSSTRI
jgi:hypothetical protein